MEQEFHTNVYFKKLDKIKVLVAILVYMNGKKA